MTKEANTSDGELRNNNEPTAFQKAMSDVFSLNAKVEGVSVKLLQAMFEMETTFDASYCEKYTKSQGTHRSEMLNGTLNDLVPSYKELQDTSAIKLGDYSNPDDKKRMADKKADAQKKLKTAQNTLRNVFCALLFLRMGPPKNDEKDANKQHYKTPAEKIDVRNGKVRFYVNGSPYGGHLAYYSIGDLVKFGQNTASDLNWNPTKKPGTPRAGQAQVVNKTAEKVKATGGHFTGAIREMSSALQMILGNVDYDKLPESDLEALRNLEASLIRKVYANKDGIYDIEALIETYSDKNERRRTTVETKNKTKAA